MLFFFVDDIVVIYEARYYQKVDEFQTKLFKKYSMRFLGEVTWFLGIRVTRDKQLNKLTLCQDAYIDKIMTKYKINLSSRPPNTPMINTEVLVKNKDAAPAQRILAYQ